MHIRYARSFVACGTLYSALSALCSMSTCARARNSKIEEEEVLARIKEQQAKLKTL